MEALSGVASGIAVASLSIQLVASIGTIKNFIRDVKGAPKELERLAELLDRLDALLQQVRDIMERQNSLQGHHFPAPSLTVFNCLKSCEASLQSLQVVVEKYKRDPGGHASALTKLKDDIRFGFQRKDIAGFETRIQQEIVSLHAAVGLNATDILMTVLPVILQVQQTNRASYYQKSQQPTLISSMSNKNLSCDLLPSTKERLPWRIREREVEVPSCLEWLGIYQWKSVRYISHEGNKKFRNKDSEGDSISQSHNVLVAWRLLNFGIQWSRQHAYGGIAASLSVYPIVKSLKSSLYFELYTISIHDLQQLFASGALHPFTRDTDGRSLLHAAAFSHRADICTLLLEVGVKPDFDRSWPCSPLQSALSSRTDRGTGLVDTIRVLWPACNDITDFETIYILPVSFLGLVLEGGLGTYEWLSMYAASLLDGCELMAFRHITQLLIHLFDDELLEYYMRGGFSLVFSLFFWCGSSTYSQSLGEVFIDLLIRLKLDVESCIAMEQSTVCMEPMWLFWDRRIIFERAKDHGWRLGWVWILDPHEPGYLLSSEHIALGPDTTFLSLEWPFNGRLEHWKPFEVAEYRFRDVAKRFERRMASKARKERARTGQKISRSRMPGGWN